MRNLNENEKNDELVKSLLDSGFDESVIAGWVDAGSITLEKSVDDGDKGDENDKKDPEEGKDPEPKEDEKEDDDLAKSISASIMKSISGELDDRFADNNEEILKSISGIVSEAVQPIVDKIEKSLDGMRKAIVAFGEQAPSFKSAGIAKAFIAKSLENGEKQNDADGRKILSVSRNRNEVRELISKSISEETDETLRKSVSEGTQSYMIDALYGEISEDAARYFYEKKNVRLVR